MSDLVAGLGFDRSKLGFAGRTALAAGLSVALAWALGLEHPQWSGMAAWAAAQPVRGALLARGWARFIGTVIGSVFGVALMVVSGGHLWVLVVGVALWHGACALTGNLLRGFTSYIAMLSGYSAAMVALLDSAHPDNIFALGLDRCLTGAVGVGISLAVGWLFAARSRPDLAEARARALARELLASLAAALEGGPRDFALDRRALSAMAEVEATIDMQAAGSRRGKAAGQRTRLLLNAEVALVLWLRAHAGGVAPDPALAAGLRAVAGLLEADDPAEAGRAAAARLRGLGPQGGGVPALAEVLEELARALDPARDQAAGRPVADLALHRDWAGGWQAGLRAGLALLVSGAIWLATGWSMGAYMMLGTAIMTSVFSTFEDPLRTLRFVLLGQVLGAVAALACRWLAWPLAGNEGQMVLLMMPFIGLGALVAAHRRLGVMAYDYNMVSLLLLQPVWPAEMGFGHSVMAGVAAVLGPVAGIAAFRLVYPVTRRRRQRALARAMLADLGQLAARPGPVRPERARAWRERLYHRLLLAVFRDGQAGGSLVLHPGAGAKHGDDLLEPWLALLQTGRAIHLLRDAAALRPGHEGRAFRAALRRLARLAASPRRAARALERAARRPGVDALPLRLAAEGVETHRDFIENASRK